MKDGDLSLRNERWARIPRTAARESHTPARKAVAPAATAMISPIVFIALERKCGRSDAR